MKYSSFFSDSAFLHFHVLLSCPIAIIIVMLIFSRVIWKFVSVPHKKLECFVQLSTHWTKVTDVYVLLGQ